jgi:hypothetical protein
MSEQIDFNKEYEKRKIEHLDDLKKLYLEVYDERFDAYTFLLKNLDNAFAYRNEALKLSDVERSRKPGWYNQNNSYGMTVCLDSKDNTLASLTERIEYLKDFDISFINVMPLLKQTLVNKPGALPEFISVDLNYGTIADLHKFCLICRQNGISVCFDNIGDYCKPENTEELFSNPVFFNKLVYDMLMFANLGVDIFKINCRPYKWNDLGIDFPYKDQDIHFVKVLRKIFEIVAPGCLLLCNGEYDNESSVSFYGSLVNQDCELINNVSNRDFLLDTIADRNVSKLRNMIESLSMLSRSTVFLNYIQDPWDSDWQNLADLCGVDAANDRLEMELATDFDMMLQGYLMMIPGVPVMYLGDELGQSGQKSMNWELASLRFNADSYQYKLYNNLMLLKRIRAVYEVFSRDARCFTYDTFDPAILGIVRTINDKKVIGLFNFSPIQKTAWLIDPGPYTDIISNQYFIDQSIIIKPYGMLWLYNKRPEPLDE